MLKAIKRNTTTTGQINKLRSDGFIPAVLYGGKKNNINISLKKIHIEDIINTETFMSKVIDLNIDGSSEKVLPREIALGLLEKMFVLSGLTFVKTRVLIVFHSELEKTGAAEMFMPVN